MHVLVEIFMAQNTPIDTLFRYHDSGLHVYQRGTPRASQVLIYPPQRAFSDTTTPGVLGIRTENPRVSEASVIPAESLLEPGHRQRGRVSRARRAAEWVRSICCAMLQSGGKSAGSLGISWMTFFCNAVTDGASERDESRVAETTGWSFKVFLSFSSSV